MTRIPTLPDRIDAYGWHTHTHDLPRPRLCRLGLHRWDTRTGREGDAYVTWNRCHRVGCRYDAWTIVDVRPVRITTDTPTHERSSR